MAIRRCELSLAAIFGIVTAIAVWFGLLRAFDILPSVAAGITALLLLGVTAAAAFVWALDRSLDGPPDAPSDDSSNTPSDAPSDDS